MTALRFGVLLFVVAALASHAAVMAGPERPVTPVTYRGTHGWAVDVVTDGTDFLTLWRDSTPGREGIYATIVSENGATRPFPPPLLANVEFAQAVWTGDSYLVLLSRDQVVTAVHLDRDGRPIDAPAPVELSGFVYDLAWNGSAALAVVFDPYDEGYNLALLDVSGRVIRSGIAFLSHVGDVTTSAAGDAFVVAWTQYTWAVEGSPRMRAHAIRVSADGTAGPVVDLLPALRGYLQIHSASGPDEVAVAVSDIHRDDPTAAHHLWRFRIDGPSAGVRTEPVVTLEPDSWEVHVVPTPGGGFAASYFHRLSNTTGIRLGSVAFGSERRRSIPIGPGEDRSSIGVMATNGTTTLIVWRDMVATYGVFFDASLAQQKSEIVPLAIAPPMQTRPSIATSGDAAMVAWVEQESVMVRRFDRAGRALDAESIRLGGHPFVFYPPRVAFTGKVWLVTWLAADDLHVMMQRISADGALLDTEPIELGEGNEPAMASNGRVTAVVMTRFWNKGIDLVRFTPEGARIDAVPIALREHASTQPAITTNGEEFLVTWTEYGNRRSDIVGARLAANGAPLDAAPIPIAQGFVDESRVAANGGDFLIAYSGYEQPAGSPLPPLIVTSYAKRVLRNGTLADTTAAQDGFLIARGALPEVAASGSGFIATFTDVTDGFNVGDPHARSIFAVSTDERGAPLSQRRTVLSAATCSNAYTLAAVGNAVWLVYPRMDAELSVQRLFTRTIAEEPARRRSASR